MYPTIAKRPTAYVVVRFKTFVEGCWSWRLTRASAFVCSPGCNALYGSKADAFSGEPPLIAKGLEKGFRWCL